MSSRTLPLCLARAALAVGLTYAAPADAQALGPFAWQLQPYCNVIVATATPVGPSFRLEGFDDQCGAPRRAPLTGTATPNPDGTIAFAFLVITSDGSGTHTSGSLSPATLSGTWIDGAGLAGAFQFGASSPVKGPPRPVSQQPAIVGAVTATNSIQVTGGAGEQTILSLPFVVPPGRRADITAFFNVELMHASVSPVGSCFGLMRLDNEIAGPRLPPTQDSVLLLDGGVQPAFGAFHAVSAGLHGVASNIGPGAHTLYVRAVTGGAGCFYSQRSLVVIATFRNP